MFIKFFTANTFDKQGFRDMLVQRCNVRCAVVDDGLIIERDEFNSANLPEWARLNQNAINSTFHTRPATEEEYNQARHKYFVLYSYPDDRDTNLTAILKEDNLSQMKKVADEWRLVTGKVGIVVDTSTGEVVYEA